MAKRGRPKGKSDDPMHISRKMRSAFYRGLMEVCKRENKAMHEVMADWIQKDPNKTFNMMSPFFPKENKTEIGGSLADFLLQISREQNRSQLPQAQERAIDGDHWTEEAEKFTDELDRNSGEV